MPRITFATLYKRRSIGFGLTICLLIILGACNMPQSPPWDASEDQVVVQTAEQGENTPAASGLTLVPGEQGGAQSGGGSGVEFALSPTTGSGSQATVGLTRQAATTAAAAEKTGEPEAQVGATATQPGGLPQLPGDATATPGMGYLVTDTPGTSGMGSLVTDTPGFSALVTETPYMSYIVTETPYMSSIVTDEVDTLPQGTAPEAPTLISLSWEWSDYHQHPIITVIFRDNADDELGFNIYSRESGGIVANTEDPIADSGNPGVHEFGANCDYITYYMTARNSYGESPRSEQDIIDDLCTPLGPGLVLESTGMDYNSNPSNIIYDLKIYRPGGGPQGITNYLIYDQNDVQWRNLVPSEFAFTLTVPCNVSGPTQLYVVAVNKYGEGAKGEVIDVAPCLTPSGHGG